MNMPANQMNTENKPAEYANLGDGTVFVKRTPNGILRSVKGSMLLCEETGELAVIQDKVMVTADGYNVLNKIAGLSIITPKSLTLPNGDVVVNPYPIIDPQSKTIEKVWVKKMAVGYSPIGNLVITSSTLLYDITTYFLQDLAKKIQFNKDAGKVCMRSMLTEEEQIKGIFHPIQGELGIWADYTHKEVLKALDTYIQNKLFAERKAQTICERNVMKKHPALAVVKVLPKGERGKHHAKVTVIGFCHDFDREDLLELAQKAENEGEDIEVNGTPVQVIEVDGEVTSEDIVSSRDEEETSASAEREFEDATGGDTEGRQLF